MKSMQKGFTLIELMIVVAIIGILAAIAIPAYQDYTIRAQVTEGLSLAGGVETAVAEFYANHGSWPTALQGSGAGELGFASDPSGKYVSDVTWTGNQIVATFSSNSPQSANATINSAKLGIAATTSSNGDIIWACGLASGPDGTTGSWSSAPKYLPAACKP